MAGLLSIAELSDRARRQSRASRRVRTIREAWNGDRALGFISVAGTLTLLAASPVIAQERVRVFLDCQARNCDSREFRTEIQFVDWVLEPAAADVHVIMTAQETGGGTQYVFDLVGRSEFVGLDERLAVTTSNTDTNVEVLDELTALLKAGLVRYAARRGYANLLDIGPGVRSLEALPGAAIQDPWNFWVFGLGIDLETEGEERENSRELSLDVSANRTTEDWKFDLFARGEIERREVELNDGRVFVNEQDDLEAAALIVRSIADHWSTGGEFEVTTSTSLNRDFAARAAAAIEWNYFPYEEANRRQLIVHYQVGVSHFEYTERTIFDRLEETRPDQRLVVAYDTRQPWGDASTAVLYSAFLDDLGKHKLALTGDIGIRIVRGLALDIRAEYDLINDQIYLSAEGLTDEEILVQRGQLPTGYQYELSVGLSFRFGSVLNNVVNNRFPSVVRQF